MGVHHQSTKMVAMVGCYQHERSEEFEPYLVGLGVPLIPRKMLLSTSPSVEISREGELWTLVFRAAMKTNTSQFTIGQEFIEKAPMGGNENKEMFAVKQSVSCKRIFKRKK